MVLSENRKRLRRRYAWGRLCLLAVVGVSLVNQLLLTLGVEYHFLWSAAMPYYLCWSCRQLGMGDVVALFAAMLVVTAYGLCWFLSGRRKMWLLLGLGLYALDTVLLMIFAATLLANPTACTLEILTHGVCIALLAVAVGAGGKLSRMPRRRPTPVKTGIGSKQNQGG